MYLQHRGSQESTDRAKNILFYAPWVLYALTTATIIVDTLLFCWMDAVSVDDHRCLTFFKLIVQKIKILQFLDITQAIVFAFCDLLPKLS